MKQTADLQYVNLIKDILCQGEEVVGRNSKTKRLFGLSMNFESTPLISIRKTAWKLALREMEWFLSGSNDINDLDASVRHWWSPWANQTGMINNNYSKQFRRFSGIDNKGNGYFFDQINHSIELLKKDPYSRRNVMTVWNPGEMADPDTPITNCHSTVIQLIVTENDFLNMIMYQRSCDMILGVPHNIIQHWAFLLYLAKKSNKVPKSLKWIGGDCHVYEQHYDGAQTMVNFDVKQPFTDAELVYKPTNDSFKAFDFSLDKKYRPILDIKFNMIV